MKQPALHSFMLLSGSEEVLSHSECAFGWACTVCLGRVWLRSLCQWCLLHYPKPQHLLKQSSVGLQVSRKPWCGSKHTQSYNVPSAQLQLYHITPMQAERINCPHTLNR